MTHIAGLAARHGLLLWEDCAQVFTGLGGYLGHQESDAAFFSFGVIKRATALGGGVARIRDAAVLSGGKTVWCTLLLRIGLHVDDGGNGMQFGLSRCRFHVAESAAVAACVARDCLVLEASSRPVPSASLG